MSVAEQAGAGVAWTTAGKLVAQVAGFAATLVLVRVLSPRDFGLVGMIVVITGLLDVFGDMGFAAALVQRTSLEEKHRSSVFWLNLLAGLALAATLAAAAPLIADFYREPRLLWLTRVLALDFVLAPLAMVQHALLSRELRFKALAGAESISTLLGSVVAVVVALSGGGVWALVARVLAASATSAAVLWFASSWRPRFTLQRAALGDLWRFSANLMGYEALAYAAQRADQLLIGRVLGATALGLYSRAHTTLMLPVSEIAGVLSRVMFPSLSKLQQEKAETKRLLLSIIGVLGLVVFPMAFGLSVLARPFIVVLFGDQWLGATTVLRIFCVVGASQAIAVTMDWIYKAHGRTDWMLRWALFAGTVLVLGVVIGLRFGSIESVALGYAVASVVILSWPRYAIPGRLIGLRAGEVFVAVRGALACALAMAGALFALGKLSEPHLAPAVDLALRALTGIALYVALARGFRIGGLGALREALSRKPAPDATAS